MRIYEICKDCGNDTFEVYKEEGELGTREECSECGSSNIGFKDSESAEGTNDGYAMMNKGDTFPIEFMADTEQETNK